MLHTLTKTNEYSYFELLDDDVYTFKLWPPAEFKLVTPYPWMESELGVMFCGGKPSKESGGPPPENFEIQASFKSILSIFRLKNKVQPPYICLLYAGTL